jgi:hypothetical protein
MHAVTWWRLTDPRVSACLRKFVMICYGVLKNRTPFDPDRASTKIR